MSLDLKPPPAEPLPGGEVANAFAGPSPALEPAPQSQSEPQLAETVEVAPTWTPDEWAKQTVNLDAPAAEAAPLGQQAPAEQKPAAPPQGYVPQQALSEARAEAKAMQEKIERMNQRFEDTVRLLQGRMDGNQGHPQPAAQAPVLPDAEQEPVKHMQARFERLEQAINGLIGMNQQSIGQQQAVQAIQAAEMAFKAEHSDYDAALNHVRARRTRELTGALGLTPQQAASALAQEEMMIAHNAMRRGDSPAQAVYRLAQEWGFKNGNGHAPEQAQAASVAAQKIAAVQNGVANAKTLGQVAGHSASVGMTLEALSDIQDPAEFSKAFDKLMGNQRASRSQLPSFLRR